METEHATQLAQMKLDAAVERSLTAAKAKNIKAARALLDLKDAKLDEKGEVVGLSDKIKELQKSDAYLFDAVDKQKKKWMASSRIRFRRRRCGKTDCAAAI